VGSDLQHLFFCSLIPNRFEFINNFDFFNLRESIFDKSGYGVKVSRGFEIKVRLKSRNKTANTLPVRSSAKEADYWTAVINDFIICIQDLEIHTHGLRF
jgi:hypothetical protein